jgi:hypothetical protein
LFLSKERFFFRESVITRKGKEKIIERIVNIPLAVSL